MVEECVTGSLHQKFHAGEFGIPADNQADDDVQEVRISFEQIFAGMEGNQKYKTCASSWATALITHPKWAASLKQLVIDGITWVKQGEPAQCQGCCALSSCKPPRLCPRIAAFKEMFASEHMPSESGILLATECSGHREYEGIPLETKRLWVARFLRNDALDTGST